LILIVADRRDVHARRVADELTKLGRRSSFLETERFGGGPLLTAMVDDPSATCWTTSTGQVVRAGEIDTVWRRRANVASLREVPDEVDRHFARQQWEDAITGVLMSLGARLVNLPSADAAAVKLRQLTAARAAGLRVPDTLITNDADQVEAFVERHRGRVVHKALRATRHHLVETRRWAETDRSALKELSLAPVIFQEEIAGPSELRITVIGEQVFAACIHTAAGLAKVDGRLDLDVPFEPYDLPPETESALLTCLDRLELSFATVDMKVTHNGELVFLEVNPQGQFLYVEIATGMPLARAMAAFLASSTPAHVWSRS
jgi:glutathione synthase/RimK-type ligase-like ATP-grasp enzyme